MKFILDKEKGSRVKHKLFGGVKVESVVRITSGGRHAYVNSNVGVIRKPLNSIPSKLLK